MSFPFIRSDLAQLAAYKPHPGGASAVAPEHIDHLDTNECPYDLPQALKEKLAWAIQHEIEANRYPDGGHLDLRQSIATYATETIQGLATFTIDHISVGNGSDELIRSLLIATCLGGEGSILVANLSSPTVGIQQPLPWIWQKRNKRSSNPRVRQSGLCLWCIPTRPRPTP